MRLFSPIVDVTRLRAEFPVLSRLAYLNAGTDGPLPERAVRASAEELERELRDGRSKEHFERRGELSRALRDAYSRLLGCDAADVALTTSATEGIGQVVSGMRLEAGDEVVTSDEEHPGLQGALTAARDVRGVVIREVPVAEVAGAVGPRTRLVACSHVSWMTGELRAVPTDVHALGCDAYAAAGQKWACGPDGSGALFVGERLREQLAVERRGYGNLADAGEGLGAKLHEDSRRFDSASLSAEANACSLAAITLLDEYGWDAIHARAATLAELFAERLAEGGREVAPRDRTTLLSFTSPDEEAERVHLAEAGVVVRNIPGRPWLRASVGAWNNEEDLERLLAALSS
jgi:L-cysteine/cystine lyase